MTTTPSRAAPPGAPPSSPACIRTARAWSCRSCRAPFRICGPARRRSPSSCTIWAIPPASSARIILGDHPDSLPTAHGFQEFWGYLYHLDAMQQVSFPDINKSPTEQGVVPPCKTIPIPGIANPPGDVDPKTRHLHDTAAPHPLDEVFRRHGQEPDGQG